MSEQADGYGIGYLVTPIVESFRRHGLFARIDKREFRAAHALSAELGANTGYFAIALRVLESIGWLDANGDDAYRLTSRAPGKRPRLGLVPLYALDPRPGDLPEQIRKRVEMLERIPSSKGDPFAWPALVQGAVVVSLAILLKHDGDDTPAVLPERAETRWARSIVDVAQAPMFGVVASYQALLQGMDDLLFGDAERTMGAFESRRDALVTGLGGAHPDREEYLRDLQRAIVDRTGEPREDAVSFPREKASRAGVDREPIRLARDGGAALCLDLFADHRIAVTATQPVDGALSVLAPDLPPFYLDAQGLPLRPLRVLSAWQRHFQELAETIGDSRLLVLATHAAAPAPRDGRVETAATACLDAMRRLAHEVPIPAEACLTLAARRGLFDDDAVKRYPAAGGPCRATLHRFTKRDYVVRHATDKDVERLWELETLCWQHTRTPRNQIAGRVQHYPQGQFVLEKDGRVLGVIYSQRIPDIEVLAGCTAADVHERHQATGPVVQLLALNVDPQAQNLGYGDQLLEFFLQRCSLVDGVTRVVGVTLCKGYRPHAGRSFEEYVQRRGRDQDPVLAFHRVHGAEIVGVVEGYRPEDRANHGHGVLVAYDPLHRTSLKPPTDAGPTTRAAAVPSDGAEIAHWVQEETARLMGVGKHDIDVDRPLMEMGLDSADLLAFQAECESRFGLALGAGFFLEHSTCGKVISFLTAAVGPSTTRSEGPMPGEVEPPASVGALDRERWREGSRDPKDGDIAVIGMACKLPGGIETSEQLWQLLASEGSAIGAFPRSRGPWADSAEFPGIEQGGFVRDVEAFDAAFFRVSPAEAQRIDPQQRLLLELAWTCLEDAGVLPASLKGTKTGVFVGASNCDYSRLIQDAGLEVEAHHGVGSALAVIANRLSYFFDLSGPSLLIDTACSSSLVALHAAMQSLGTGECRIALVGGVNVICHPDLSMAYYKAGMLAPDGRCKVFDAGADGYVRSEGAVMLLLKPARQAAADGDPIHAVVKGSAINHGGLAAGLTVPSPHKQSELLQMAWTNAGIAPHELTYIEAHGTGTPLGDPIEVEGIQRAYAQASSGSPSQGCAIGSVKSNLGHLESAAGLVGLLKVIVAMQHRQLPASIHVARLNPKIQLEGTPFRVQERLGPWEAERTRLAGVSSFGSGGANAHVVVQEHEVEAPVRRGAREQLFVLSAADEDRLRRYAADAVRWLESAAIEDRLDDAVYTWQVGRTPLKHRLAIKASGAADLLSKLKPWLAGRRDVADVWFGQACPGDSGIGRVWRSTSGRELIDRALLERDLEQLAVVWTSGAEMDWRKLHEAAADKPRRLRLPTYPFARERHWIDAAEGRRVADSAAAAALLHPLLHSNTSDLSEHRYSSTFRGDELFLADHRLDAEGGAVRKVLPAVAHLEMARAAVERSSKERAEGSVLELRDVVWTQPVEVAEGKRVSIALSTNDGQQIDYEIYGQDAEEEVVYCRGRAVWSRPPAPTRLDLEVIARDNERSLAVHQGSHQVLARLRRPDEADGQAGDYILHPGLLDGAVQACIALLDGGSAGVGPPRWPVALEALRIVSPCLREMVAWVRHSPGNPSAEEAIKLDVDLCDVDGNVCVQMQGLSTRVLGPASGAGAAPAEGIGCLLAIPVWQPCEVGGSEDDLPEYVEHHVILCELATADAQALEASLPGSSCLSLRAKDGQTVAQRYGDHALACFERMQAILRTGPRGKVLVQLAVAGDPERSLFAGLSPLLRAAAAEDPRLVGQVILVPGGVRTDELSSRLQAEKDRGQDTLIRYEAGVRQAARWRELAKDGREPPLAWLDRGVYLITGGLGGLGVVFAREILGRMPQARVVLTGRSPWSAEKQARLAGLSAEAGRVSYRQMDLGDLEDVKRVIGGIRDEHGSLDGILHCAGMMAGGFILKKSAAQFREVLAPKVTGTFHLDQATQDMALDFLVLFSSIGSAIGFPGQADYAAANGFMDQFAVYRNRQVAEGVRYGRTRSVQWALWQASRMSMDSATAEMLEQTMGVRPMPTTTGLRAFHRVLALPHDRIFVGEGEASTMAAHLHRTWVLAPSSAASPAAASHAGALMPTEATVGLDELQRQLKTMLAGVLRIEPSAVDLDQAFVDLGLDSLLGTGLIVAINKRYGTRLSNTRIYDHPSVRDLSSLLAQELTKVPVDSRPLAAAPARPSAPARERDPMARGGARRARVTARSRPLEDEVAIVGMSGRYPGARNLREYWRNLREGRSSIVEVPASRWDSRRYYDPDPAHKNKTVSKWMGALDDIDCFDPLFFRISPQEAEYMDPQHRLFLQEAYRAFEDAGYAASRLSETRCGVYLGITTNDYALLLSQSGIQPPLTSNYYAIAAGRVAYYLNLKGPAISIDTACSSSLVAMHLACQALRTGEIDLALAGGVTLWLSPHSYLAMSQVGLLSPTGQCKTFDDSADGIVNGDGVGTVVLKRLRDAQGDNDFIHGVVLGSGVNQDGKTNGITAPSVSSQIELARGIYARYGIDPETIGYVEAHGTGTALGDPIELEALATAFREKTTRKNFCALGSVKSNIGHTTAAAGVAGVQKVLLSLRHATLVPSLNVTKETSRFDFASSPFYVCRETRPWNVTPGSRRLAAVSSFGFSGTNAHMVIGEYLAPAEPPRALSVVSAGTKAIVPLSARKAEPLRQRAGELLEFIRNEAPSTDLASMAYTLQVGREAMEERLGLVVSTVEELAAKLEAYVTGAPEMEDAYRGHAKRSREALSSLGSDADLERMVHKWIAAGTLSKVAELWAKGFDLDWNKLYGEAKPPRVSLPTYPFARERYWIPAVSAAVVDVRREPTPAGPSGATWGEYWNRHDALLVKVLWGQLQSLGLLIEAESFLARWKGAVGLPPLYERWLDETMLLLAERGRLSYDGEWCRLADPLISESGSVWDEWNREKDGWAQDPDLCVPGTLVETTLRALPEILTGRRRATEILFPNGSMELVEGFYKNNAQADYFNEVLADAAVAHLTERGRTGPNDRVRILEIGAGTGGSTATLLRKLEGHRERIAEYCYTDLSRAFLTHGEDHYGARHPFLTFRLFDVEEPLAAQGIEVGAYDAVVATNVLHATRNIRETLRNAKAALKPGGLLFLNEMADRSLFTHLTFGLLEGWWLSEDPTLRIRGCPMLSPEAWSRVLLEEGFRSVLFPAQEALALGQQVIVAESDGVIGQEPVVARKAQKAAAGNVLVQPRRPAALETGTGSSESVQAFLVEAVSQMMKIQIEDVDQDAELSEFGFDSITLTRLSHHLNDTLQLELAPSIFFEHPTLRGFAAHLVKVHPEAMERKFHLWRPTEDGALEPARSSPRVRVVGEERPPMGTEPVAIIGMSGCFPQADDIDAFWQNLLEGRDCIRQIPEERWNGRSLHGDSAEDAHRPDMQWAGWIEGVDLFDPLFFGISPREAELMDPQQRLLMTQVWKAVEDAGYSPQSLSGSMTALLVGTLNSGYCEVIHQASAGAGAESATGRMPSMGPNRMSYLLNLHGPSEPIETACSSSLVAIHRGRELITSGQCEMAIVGGVNTLVSFEEHLGLSKAGMLSADGHCKAFSAGANGYVRGEGAAMLVLKSLKDAERDGDHIHALLRGSAENHSGRSTSLTAPNPKAQAELIKRVYRQAGIDCRTVGHIEAHGTGTPLGDPVEINGLKSAFQELSGGGQAPSPYCGLASVKSNIGHLELAAGVAGVIKVLLQMRHKTLVKSLHCDEINPYIQLEGSPFYIVRENQAWMPPSDDQGRELPRRAGVSSFGFGGVNAHVVLEEYLARERPRPTVHVSAPRPAVVVLSARNEERLRERAERLRAGIAAQGLTDADLEDVAYTLQVGREAMEHRIAMAVGSMKELQEKLAEYIAGTPSIQDFYRGEVKRSNDAVAVFKADEELQEAIAKWIQRGKLSKLLGLWVKGLDFDWSQLHGDEKPRRLSLPTYPFARERCWIGAANREPPSAERASTAVLHPLLHANTSDLSEQRYRSIFTGREFFLADHQLLTEVGSRHKVLPGVAYLEMARAAVEAVWPERPEGSFLEMGHVVWAKPAVIGGSTAIGIALAESDDEQVAYEIYGEDDAEGTVFCQGRATWSRQPAPARLDLQRIKEEIGTRRVDAEAVYASLAAMGVDYGASFRALTAIDQGDEQALAHLRLPRAVEGTFGEYALHPSLMDGALQACSGLLDGWSRGVDRPRLPFALERMRLVSPCRREMVAWVRYSPGGGAGDKVVKLDIDLCDTAGDVCVQMQGFSTRVLGAEDGASAAQGRSVGCLLATPVWEPSGIVDARPTGEYVQHHVILCDLPVGARELESRLDHSACVSLPDEEPTTLARRYTEYASACFERIRSILQGRPQGKVLVQLVTAGDPPQALFAGLSGLLKTATLENPQLVGQSILVPVGIDVDELARRLRAEKGQGAATQSRYEGGERYVVRWREIAVEGEEPPLALMDRGLYLITGGLGGLGVVFAKEILARAPQARVVLTGRSTLGAEKRARLEALVRAGQVSYRQLNLGDLDDVRQLIGGIQDEYGALSGILHGAGMIADSFMLKKDSDTFREVLVPKVTGTCHLDEASQHVALDFFVMFSSLTSVIGNLGQADYAAANGFLDEFAAYRNGLVRAGRRHGRTRSIHWPLWQDGGMGMDAATREALERTTGMRPMGTATGLRAFHRALALPHDRILVAEGDLPRMRRALLEGVPATSAAPAKRAAASVDVDSRGLREKAQDYLRQQLSGLLKLPAHKIDPQALLEKYGIDSILAIQLTNHLEATFGSLPKTLFFEYQTLGELAEYLLAQYAEPLKALLIATTDPPVGVVPSLVPAVSTVHTRPIASRRPRRQPAVGPRPAVEADPIAIIGLSGRYPEAIDIEAFWHNLRDGRDCIVEVPQDRWDWREYFTEDRTKSGHHYSKWGGFIAGVDEFDPLFFNISPREAAYLDPQERLFLQHAWKAIEDAGYTRASLQVPCEEDLPGQVGVYAGVWTTEYQMFGAEASVLGQRVGVAGSVANVANRVSYALNLHGPSLTLDTMCSASLTAIHLACQDLKQGRTCLAIAGGVNVSIHPNKYLVLSALQAISTNGHCHAFGEGGDGYIPSEGVGVVVLKRLPEAERDGDHIYGIIRGSAINHGGKTNGYTVPNPQAQASTISRALAESRIDARHISYVEAHGTGTRLGDPIEIAALSKAFQHYTGDTGFCAIGSAKSNIGHCESAAAVAGLTKVLLQMQHRQLVPSLHSAQLNPHIEFGKTPFVVNQSLKAWEPPEIDGRRRSRIAGVSSFGAGGSNAHLIVEEYETPVRPSMAPDRAVVLLSGRTAEALQQRARDLLAFVRPRLGTIDLAALAYTLQVGREAMDERLGLLVSTVEQLAVKLEAYVAGEREIEDAYHGQVKRSREALSLFSTDADLQDTVDKWVAQRKLSKLADLWAKGLEVDWVKLYGETRPPRLSLPTYPFARERYWIPEVKAAAASRPVSAPAAAAYVIHPLLHRNTSDLAEQRFSSTFSGREPFFSDHVVKGQRVLPGVAYLEMARAGVEQAAAAGRPKPVAVQLTNVVWVQPVTAASGVDVHLGLYPREDAAIDYEVYSIGEADGRIVHAQGRALLAKAEGETARVDLPRLQAVCGRVLPGAECYQAFRSAGLEYGAAHQAIESLHIGGDGPEGRQVLARLRRPRGVAEGASTYGLHPGLMDGALQAALGLTLTEGAEPPRQVTLPFSLDRLDVEMPSPAAGWAWVRYRDGVEGGGPRKIDIDVCDEEGNVCVRLRGLSGRALQADATDVAGAPVVEAPVATVLLAPVWDVAELEPAPAWPSPTDRLAIVGGREEEHLAVRQRYPDAHAHALTPEDSVEALAETLRGCGTVNHLLWSLRDLPVTSLADEALVEGQKQGAVFGFRLIKALLQLGYGSRELGWTIVTPQAQAVLKHEAVHAVHASVPGLIGSMAKEYPNWKVRLIDLEADGEWPLDEMLSLAADPRGEVWAHRKGEWYRQRLVRCELPAGGDAAYRNGGVYVVIGGAGGVGEVFSEYLIRRHRAQLVWIGRRERDGEIAQKQDRLSALGPAPDYIPADAGDRVQLQRAYEQIRQRYGVVHGVIHSALQLLDRSLWQMDEERFTRALSSKVDTSVRLARVFEREELDFVMFFSSLQSFAKAAGQSNYAAGCTFTDAYARELGRHWRCPVKVMHWGFWGSVGAVATKEYQERMARAGLGSIEPGEGMPALEQLLDSPLAEVMLLKTSKADAVVPVRPGERLYVAGSEAPSLLEILPATEERETPAALLEDKRRGEGFEDLVAKLLLAQMNSLGAFAGEPVETWRRRIGTPELYTRWLEETVRVMAARGYIRLHADACALSDVAPIHSQATWDEWDAWMQSPEGAARRAQARLAEATLRALPDILRGERQAPEVLFPSSSMELVQGIYKDNASADYFNDILADLVADYVEERTRRDPAARMRILEIGAGTGGSTWSIFERLAPWEGHLEEYAYTDLSKTFLLRAEERYGQRPYFKCHLFDVEKPLSGQAIEGGGYDLVVAGNVLHATRSIRQSVRNAKATLKRHGILLLNELSANTVFAHVTFGLTEGWWRFEDPELRLLGSPALSMDRWRQVLQEEGFGPVLFPSQHASLLGQQVIAAESDGVLRQGQAEAEASPSASRRVDPSPAARTVPREARVGGLVESVHAFLVEAVSDLMKVRTEDVDLDAELSEFGFDSISFTGFSNHLNRSLELELTPSIFFEHPTLRGFADYLVRTEQEALRKKFHVWNPVEEAPAPAEAPRASAPPPSVRGRRRFAGEPPAASPTVVAEVPPSLPEPVAIIGMSGCFPQADDVDAFWQNLLEGRDCIREIPKGRGSWRAVLYGDGTEDARPAGIQWGGLIDGVDEFDPLFFGISPREAELMDPQQRLLMTHVWKAIEDAGYSPPSLSGSNTALLVGTVNSGYSELVNKTRVASSGDSVTGMVSSIGPNRMSYLLDLHGPSEPIETACSSSLVAVHRGRELVASGQCEMAIVGGVSTMISPEAHQGFGKAGMLSEDGRCKTFSARANGYVRGEGAGMLVLKRLKDAEGDGDHIYALLRGSAENHGGRAASLTAPNPKAQAEVVNSAYARAGIDCRTVGYIEAHGTGTALGDPIEIDGLKSAFRERDGKGSECSEPYCGLGSVKTNVGHLELAAGVVGVIKVLLQLRHETLVKSLHCDEINPYIQLEGSPFYIVRENRAWPRLRDDQGRELPRRAGVSSFGFGGVNAHVVLEEYRPVERPGRGLHVSAPRPAVVVLSARNEERLREQARRLLATITAKGVTDADLPDLAYTLQVGREAMEHRIAMAVRSMTEVQAKIADYIDGKPSIEDFHRGEVKRSKDALAVFKADDELQEAIAKWIQRGKLSKLLGLWVKGLDFDWRQLHAGEKPRRLSLPTYPFARERYWIEATAVRSRREPSTAVLHPLLHANTSDLTAQRYSSTFTGEESFLADHRVRTKGGMVERVLPAAAYLEMARAAVERCSPARAEAAVLELGQLIWLQPIVVTESKRVSIGLSASEDEEIEYEVYSQDGNERVVHFRGRASRGSAPAPAPLDLDRIRRQIGPGQVEADKVYAAFVRRGFVQGPAFRVITVLHQGRDQLLAYLRLPEGAESPSGDYVLHPGLMDGALQACAGLLDGWSETVERPRLPFALEQLWALRPCRRAMVAWVRYAPGAEVTDKVVALDIDLSDESGNVCVQMRGLTSRVLGTSAERPEPTAVAPFDSVFYRQLMADISSGKITIEEAVELG